MAHRPPRNPPPQHSFFMATTVCGHRLCGDRRQCLTAVSWLPPTSFAKIIIYDWFCPRSNISVASTQLSPSVVVVQMQILVQIFLTTDADPGTDPPDYWPKIPTSFTQKSDIEDNFERARRLFFFDTTQRETRFQKWLLTGSSDLSLSLSLSLFLSLTWSLVLTGFAAGLPISETHTRN